MIPTLYGNKMRVVNLVLAELTIDHSHNRRLLELKCVVKDVTLHHQDIPLLNTIRIFEDLGIAEDHHREHHNIDTSDPRLYLEQICSISS